MVKYITIVIPTLTMTKIAVTHPVVSQVNPHVHLFFFAPRGSAGKPVAHRKGKGGWLFLIAVVSSQLVCS